MIRNAAWKEQQAQIRATVPIPRGYHVVHTGLVMPGDMAWDRFGKVFSPPASNSSVDDFFLLVRPKPQETKGYITTVSGQRVYLLDPKPNQIRLLDVSHHLAWKCRFNAHMNRWYSNAEHLLNCAFMAGDNLPLRRKLFVHDAGEFVTGDLTTPVKRMFPDYKKFCDDFQDFMYTLFCGDKQEPPELKVIDQRMTATEMMYLRNHSAEDITTDPYELDEIRGFFCYERDNAQLLWLEEFYKLFPGYTDA